MRLPASPLLRALLAAGLWLLVAAFVYWSTGSGLLLAVVSIVTAVWVLLLKPSPRPPGEGGDHA